MAATTFSLGGRRIAVDLAHLAFASAIAGWAAWLCWDAKSAGAEVENLILIAPGAVVALVLYGFVAASCLRIVPEGETPAPLREPIAMEIGVKVAGSMALLAAFVIAGPTIGFDVACFVYLLAMLAFLGERRVLVLILAPAIFCALVIYCFNILLATPLPLLLMRGAA